MARPGPSWLALWLGLSLAIAAAPAGAEPVLELLPVLSPGQGGELAPADPARDAALRRHAETLGEVLSDAGEDLGYDVERKTFSVGADYREEQLALGARQNIVVSPRIEAAGSRGVLVRLVAVRSDSKVVFSRSEAMEPSLIEVRAVVMLRDLLQAAARPSAAPPAGAAATQIEGPPVEPAGPRSPGRAVLALNAALLGGYIGFSLQRASGSDDERLVYPLTALGAGMGLGASLLVSEEWDIGVGDAWYLSAGAVWPIAGSLLLARSYEVEPENRYIYGIVGASAGVALATAALSLHGPMSEGGATVAHSGGAFGLGLGGISELLILGETEETPVQGLGYGALIGVLAGGVLATQIDVPTSRVLLIDLGASLGALGGAAAASPLLLVEEEDDPTRTRLWLSSVVVGTLGGAALGALLTRGTADSAEAAPVLPYAGVVAEVDGGTRTELGVTGAW